MTPITQQIEQITAMALQHFREPGEEMKRQEYEIELLRQRVREQDAAMCKVQQWIDARSGK